MERVRMYVEMESAFVMMSALGTKALCEFRDLNPSTLYSNRTFIAEMKNIEEMERKCRVLRNLLEARNVLVSEVVVEEERRSPNDLDRCVACILPLCEAFLIRSIFFAATWTSRSPC